ncbi:MAG: hypothetical protein ACI9S7_000072 [Candidatus Paceibacteria bacterium]|jgi:hypothetical protein|tara:strand:+ start:10174 stop:10515 length:342 start_codon:yes stop_codon:yes gene_type:complete
MANKCPHCDFKITSRNQLCEDYKDPERAYGCPACGTFYILPRSAAPTWKQWILYLTLGFSGGLISSLVQLNGHSRWWFWSYVLFVGIGLGLHYIRSKAVTLEASGHRVTPNND